MERRSPEKNSPEVSVIVLAYKEERVIIRCLESLKSQKTFHPFEVIAVCSGLDETPRIVQNSFPEARLIHSKERLSPPQARNAGLRLARGEYILFLSADCTVPSDWIAQRMHDHKEGYPCVGGIVRLRDGMHPVSLSEYWAEYSPYLEKRRAGMYGRGVPHGLSYSSSIFKELGLFDEKMRRGEDTLFNSKIREAGVEVYFNPAIVLFHQGSTTIRELIAHQFGHGRALVQLRSREGNGWERRSFLSRFLSLSLFFLSRRIMTTYRRIFRWQLCLGPLAILYAPLILTGIFSISVGACVELFGSSGQRGKA